MPYVYRPYPKVLYHPTQPPKVVYNEAQKVALGADWVENPFPPGQGEMPVGSIDPDGFIVVAGNAPFRILEEFVPGTRRITHYIKNSDGQVMIAGLVEFDHEGT